MTPYQQLVVAVTEWYAGCSMRRRIGIASRKLEKMHAELAEAEGLLHDVRVSSTILEDVYKTSFDEARESLEALQLNLRYHIDREK